MELFTCPNCKNRVSENSKGVIRDYSFLGRMQGCPPMYCSYNCQREYEQKEKAAEKAEKQERDAIKAAKQAAKNNSSGGGYENYESSSDYQPQQGGGSGGGGKGASLPNIIINSLLAIGFAGIFSNEIPMAVPMWLSVIVGVIIFFILVGVWMSSKAKWALLLVGVALVMGFIDSCGNENEEQIQSTQQTENTEQLQIQERQRIEAAERQRVIDSIQAAQATGITGNRCNGNGK